MPRPDYTPRRSRLAAPPRAARRDRRESIEVRIGDEIEPVEAEYIDSGIEEAARQHAGLVLITMDTPGGLEDSMQLIIQHILSSPVPVARLRVACGKAWRFRWILHPGCPLGYRGDEVLGTHAGAASPLDGYGWRAPKHYDDAQEENPERRHGLSLRSYAGKRGRNVAPRGNRRHRRQSIHR